MVFKIEDNLSGNQPNARVTVNEYCSKASTYSVTVSFGLREKGSNNNCDIQDSQRATLAPNVAMTFYVDEAIVMLSDGYEYCFNISSGQNSRGFSVFSVNLLVGGIVIEVAVFLLLS